MLSKFFYANSSCNENIRYNYLLKIYISYHTFSLLNRSTLVFAFLRRILNKRWRDLKVLIYHRSITPNGSKGCVGSYLTQPPGPLWLLLLLESNLFLSTIFPQIFSSVLGTVESFKLWVDCTVGLFFSASRSFWRWSIFSYALAPVGIIHFTHLVSSYIDFIIRIVS